MRFFNGKLFIICNFINCLLLIIYILKWKTFYFVDKILLENLLCTLLFYNIVW
jgi:hypothetical protein